MAAAVVSVWRSAGRFGQDYVRLASTIDLLADDLVQTPGISKFCKVDVVVK